MPKRFWIAAALLAALPCGRAAAQQNPSFNLVNRGSTPIHEVYASAEGMTTWGRDRLGNAPILPGQAYAVRLPVGGCIYDIRVVYDGGQAEERRGLNTCAMDSVAFPSGRSPQAPPSQASPSQPQGRTQQATDDPSFRLLNRARVPVNEIYASLVGRSNWGEDRLGDDTVPAGGSKVIRLPSGPCLYDVRVVFASGEATEKRRINLCTLTDLQVP